MRILLAVDGSDAATRAARHAIVLANAMKSAPELHVLYSDPPLMRAAAVQIGPQALAKYHDENARYALRRARAQLKRAGVAFEEHHAIAEPADAILRFVKSRKCDLVVMGSHGRGALKNALLGSVSAKVLSHCATPLTIVR
jgi:nucleotide-binding universal stress UspA family protein